MILTPVTLGVLLIVAAAFWASHAAHAGTSEPCRNKLSSPILVPRALYDLREYCGGEITIF